MDLPIEIGAYSYHGIDCSYVNSSKQVETTCPFCDKEKHFFISTKTDKAGLFNCKSCGMTGNRYVFLHQWYEKWLETTTDADYKRLAKHRKTKLWKMFATDQLAYDRSSRRWLAPVFNDGGSLVDLQTYDVTGSNPPQSKDGKPTPKWCTTKGCSVHLEGVEGIAKEGPIFICEGRWDRITVSHVFPEVDEREAYTILSIPGCMTLCEKDYKQHFTNRDVVILTDSGLVGPEKKQVTTYETLATLLSRKYHSRSIQVCHWPESYPSNHDVTDLTNAKGIKESWGLISSYLRPYAAKGITVPEHKASSIAGIVKEFRATKVHVNQDFIDALIVVLGTIVSIQMGGIPVWLHLIATAGSGKSLILESTMEHALCHYVSDLRYQSLLSGYIADPDPSLLAHIQKRVLIVKDYTTILEKNEVAQKELLGLLREAYDGQIVKPYGNGVVRIYPDPSTGMERCYFGIVTGVTPRIHAQSRSALGERFIKFEIGKPAVGARDVVRQAILATNKSWEEVQNAGRRQAVVKSFLDSCEVDRGPDIGRYIEQVIDLGQFTAACRTRPERDRQTQDLLYEATAESASRLAKQFTKLAQGIAVVRRTKIDEHVMRLVRKAAWHTAHGWHRSVFAALSAKPGQVLVDIARKARPKLSVTSTGRVLNDLHDLGLADKKSAAAKSNGGRPADEWSITKHGREIVAGSKIFSK